MVCSSCGNSSAAAAGGVGVVLTAVLGCGIGCSCDVWREVEEREGGN